MINLLDGLRDLKAPLASGLIVLFGFWLIFANEIASAGPNESLAGNIHRLVNYLGGPATLGLLAFLGYIVGLVLSLHVLYRTLERAYFQAAFRAMRFFFKHLPLHLPEQEYSSNTNLRLGLYIMRILEDAKKDKGWTESDIIENIKSGSSSTYNWILGLKSGGRWKDEDIDSPSIVGRLLREITADIDLLAVQLHAEKDKIFEKYDKNKTESDFRAAVILPLVFVAFILMIRFSNESQHDLVALTLAAALLMWFRLAKGAHQRLIEANDAVLNSLIVGHIKSARMLIFEQPRLPEPDGGASFSATAI